jgi:TonB family protein
MKKLVVGTILLLILQSRSWAGTDALTQQLLMTAERQAGLFHENPTPIQLQVSFVAQIQTPMHGDLTLRWAGNDRWWRKVVMGSFEQIDIRNGDKLYTRRNLAFTPYPVFELAGLLQFAGDFDGLHVIKQKQRMEGSVGVNCLQVKIQDGKGKPHEICVSSESHDILSHEWKGPPDELSREQFADYFEFGNYRYPRNLELFANGSRLISAHVDDLRIAEFDDSLLVPPKGAIERRQCAGLQQPVRMNAPEPVYPKSVAGDNLAGDTLVSMTVLADGSVTDIRVVGTAARSLDEVALETLRRWKFKPAMCGSEPVVVDVHVLVTFRTP